MRMEWTDFGTKALGNDTHNDFVVYTCSCVEGMYGHTDAHSWMCVSVEARGQPQMSPRRWHSPFFETRSLPGLEFVK